MNYLKSGNPPLIQDNLVNYSLCERIRHIWYEIETFQNVPYNFEQVSLIKQYLLQSVESSKEEISE
jgi:hypothetical protein